MKKLLICFATMLCFTACFQPAKGPNGVTYKTVVEYNDYIVDRQLKVIKSIKEMAAKVGVDDSLAISMLADISTKSLQDAKEIEGMPAWKGNTNFRDKAVGIFRFYGTTYCTDFKELIELAHNPEITQSERDGLKEKGKAIDRKEEKMSEGFISAQKEFSEKNHLTLEHKDEND